MAVDVEAQKEIVLGSFGPKVSRGLGKEKMQAQFARINNVIYEFLMIHDAKMLSTISIKVIAVCDAYEDHG